MRRIFTLLMVLSLCILTACGSRSNEPSGAETSSACVSAFSRFSAPNNRTNFTEFETQLFFSYVVVKDLREKTVTAEDGTVLAVYRYELPTLQVQDEEGKDLSDSSDPDVQKALKVAATFNNRMAELVSKSDFKDLIAMAKEDYSWYQESEASYFTQYTDEMTYSVYQTNQFISLLLNFYWYTGGAHPNFGIISYNFDLKNGTFFDPMSFTDDPLTMTEVVTEHLVKQAEERAKKYGIEPEEFFFEGYKDNLGKWEEYTVCFSEDGCHVIFAPYDIASYAAGPQNFTITTDFLEPYLNDYGRTMLGLSEETEG